VHTPSASCAQVQAATRSHQHAARVEITKNQNKFTKQSLKMITLLKTMTSRS
jgi:hypothetical protein